MTQDFEPREERRERLWKAYLTLGPDFRDSLFDLVERECTAVREAALHEAEALHIPPPESGWFSASGAAGISAYRAAIHSMLSPSSPPETETLALCRRRKLRAAIRRALAPKKAVKARKRKKARR